MAGFILILMEVTFLSSLALYSVFTDEMFGYGARNELICLAVANIVAACCATWWVVSLGGF